MKKIIIILILSFIPSFTSTLLYAQEAGGVGVVNSETDAGAESEVPPGMEIKKVGGINFMVPKGAKLYKRGGMTIMEGASAYSARRLDTIESRLEKVEKSIKELKEEVKKLQ